MFRYEESRCVKWKEAVCEATSFVELLVGLENGTAFGWVREASVQAYTGVRDIGLSVGKLLSSQRVVKVTVKAPMVIGG